MLNKNFWTKYFSVYDYLNHLIPYQELMDDVIKNLDIKRNELILDIGCGTGNIAFLLNNFGVRMVGIDSSLEGINKCRKKIPAMEVIQGDIKEALPFKDNYFDKVLTVNTLYTIDISKRLGLMKEIYRVLKPEGKIVIANIAKGFNSCSIYIDHIRKSFNKYGFFPTLSVLIKLSIPTIRIFYYNYLINREDTKHTLKFVDLDEQANLLKQSGFINITDNLSVYSNQGILNTGKKK